MSVGQQPTVKERTERTWRQEILLNESQQHSACISLQNSSARMSVIPPVRAPSCRTCSPTMVACPLLAFALPALQCRGFYTFNFVLISRFKSWCPSGTGGERMGWKLVPVSCNMRGGLQRLRLLLTYSPKSPLGTEHTQCRDIIQSSSCQCVNAGMLQLYASTIKPVESKSPALEH